MRSPQLDSERSAMVCPTMTDDTALIIGVAGEAGRASRERNRRDSAKPSTRHSRDQLRVARRLLKKWGV
jgi:hypothetical protein